MSCLVHNPKITSLLLLFFFTINPIIVAAPVHSMAIYIQWNFKGKLKVRRQRFHKTAEKQTFYWLFMMLLTSDDAVTINKNKTKQTAPESAVKCGSADTDGVSTMKFTLVLSVKLMKNRCRNTHITTCSLHMCPRQCQVYPSVSASELTPRELLIMFHNYILGTKQEELSGLSSLSHMWNTTFLCSFRAIRFQGNLSTAERKHFFRQV